MRLRPKTKVVSAGAVALILLGSGCGSSAKHADNSTSGVTTSGSSVTTVVQTTTSSTTAATTTTTTTTPVPTTISTAGLSACTLLAANDLQQIAPGATEGSSSSTACNYSSPSDASVQLVFVRPSGTTAEQLFASAESSQEQQTKSAPSSAAETFAVISGVGDEAFDDSQTYGGTVDANVGWVQQGLFFLTTLESYSGPASTAVQLLVAVSKTVSTRV